jgi:pimeloyl-ACP methyl ester carboxylesterase
MESGEAAGKQTGAGTDQDAPGRELIDVEVPGGALAVELIRSGTEPVLAIHGISSQRRLWNWLRAAEPGLSLIAPDLRGRGASVQVAGRSSVAGTPPTWWRSWTTSAWMPCMSAACRWAASSRSSWPPPIPAG